MKARKLTIILLLVLSFTATSCGRQKYPFFKPLNPTVKTLSNGVTLFVLEDHELPTAQFYFYLRGGSVYDPVGKEGLGSVAMQSIRFGGSSKNKPEEIDEKLEAVGAELEVGASPEFFSASLALLKKDLPLGLDILFDLLKNPSLDPVRFEIVKARAKETIERGNEDPLTVATREFPPFVYGPESLWGRHPTSSSIDQIQRNDLLDFQRNFLYPDRLIIAVAGDFSADEITQSLEKELADWKPSGQVLPPIPPLKENFQKQVVVIPRKNLSQSTLVIGHLGAKRDNPDKFALIIMNYIFGGSGALTSRLGDEIRSSAGKAYSVWSDFGFGKDFGLFRSVAQTASDNTDWVIRKMQSMIQEMHDKPSFQDIEIERAKKAILRSLLFDFETRFAQVKEQARFHLQGYPPDYLEEFQRKIADVKKSDLERVAKQYLHPDNLQTLVISDERGVESLKEQISDIGSFEVRNLP